MFCLHTKGVTFTRLFTFDVSSCFSTSRFDIVELFSAAIIKVSRQSLIETLKTNICSLELQINKFILHDNNPFLTDNGLDGTLNHCFL